jgi:hypothetical protein
VLEKTGSTERTTDPEFDSMYSNFQSMIGDMNECGAAVSSTLVNQVHSFAFQPP